MVVAEVCSSMKYPERCQYKHAKQKKYHVRNWAEYNEGLRRRGDLTVWFDEEAIANWKADKTGKPGGQRVVRIHHWAETQTRHHHSSGCARRGHGDRVARGVRVAMSASIVECTRTGRSRMPPGSPSAP